MATYHPPWNEPLFIGVAGGSGSGKSSVVSTVINKLNVPWTVVISTDSYYKQLTDDQRERAFRSEYDFDAPEALEWDLLYDHMMQLKQGKRIYVPQYAFDTHTRTDKTVSVYAPYVVIIEGIYALYDERIRRLFDTKVFVDADMDVCLARRTLRDMAHRGRDLDGIIAQWFRFVKPNYIEKVAPTSKYADILVTRGSNNYVAIDMLIALIRQALKQKAAQQKEQLESLSTDKTVFNRDNLLIVPQTPQFEGLSTIIMDRTTSMEDFIFYFERIATILIEHALDSLDVAEQSVTTATGMEYKGLRFTKSITGVAILRAGGTFDIAFRRTVPEMSFGRLLILSDTATGEPALRYEKLPKCITNDTVILTDPQVGSAAAALMAIQVMLDHGVSEKNIIFITFLASRLGIMRILKAFPKIRLIVGKPTDEMVPRFIDARYFGT
ncbi:hypothetical protein CANCADRAFT_138604 [Tortispora caseinolytica NRRL Y-17796]|uniref:Uridine kinase n=1 Tax=Tortispora caseinolytica NRRL Y-17796 TaxID=767744 RepID=A0A1E4TC51_9ASCO|nr:hypothetical protein CANCADRAFT_138604 [Tortispora caseinolytica NRRL Y-17796]